MSAAPQPLSPFGNALAGALGACFANAIVYPIDIAKTRIQASTAKGHERDKLTVIGILLRILKEEGIKGILSGFTATMLNTFSMQYAYFFFYSLVRGSYIKRLTARLPPGTKPPPLSTAAELALGAVAGAFAQICTIPVAVIATRQQIGRSLDAPRSRRGTTAGDPEKAAGAPEEAYDDSFFSVAREIIQEEGVTGLWLGLGPSLVLTVNPAITYGLYERVKGITLRAAGGTGAGKMSPWMTFLVGATSKTLATIVTYPYIMAKVRIQARTADVDVPTEASETESHAPHTPHHTHSRHAGALDILADVLRRKGPLGWYQGMGAQITKAVLAQALLFMSKEQFEHWAMAILVLFSRLQTPN